MSRLAFVGEQGSGKSTAANEMLKCKWQKNSTPTGRIVKFAGPIYETLSILGVPKNREFMQKYADLVRGTFGHRFFIDLLLKRIYSQKPGELLVCDDVRYPAELRALQEVGFRTVFIESPEKVRMERLGDLFKNPEHSSEAQVPRLINAADLVVGNGEGVGLSEFKLRVRRAGELLCKRAG